MSSAYAFIPEPAAQEYFNEYVWLVVVGALAAFFMAWGIGANDVANSFATSVGSRTLKLWQAMVVAGIFEFAGCIGLGAETTKTIASDIANTALYKEVPELYMYGMVCALTVAGFWLLLATFWRLPVSTTHSIIGSVMGFALVYGGWSGVLWNEEKGDFPYSKGFLPVVLSWFFSPLISGTLSVIIFLLNRALVLRRQNSTIKAIWALPVLIFFTVFINLMFVMAKGAKKEMAETWPCDPKGGPGMFDLYYEDCSDLNNAAAWIAAVAGVGIAVIAGLIGIPLLKRDYAKGLITDATMRTQAAADAAEKAVKDAELKAQGMEPEPALEELVEAARRHNESLKLPQKPEHVDGETNGYLMRVAYWYATIPFIAFYLQCKKGLCYDIFEGIGYSKKTEEMHANAEVFAPRTERVYQALQVITACCVSFAHGSNDVANAIGPFSAIFTTYQTSKLPGSTTTTPFWIFVMGGLGIVLGLLMYGYNIIMELGVNMIHLTPSRGFSAELATGLTVSLASFFGIPVSTTQIIVGAEVGIGLCEWGRGQGGGLDGTVLMRTFAGWIWTILLGMGCTAALFSAGAYAPSILMAETIIHYRYELANMGLEQMTAVNQTNNLWASDEQWWTGPVVSPMRWNGSRLYPGFLNKSINTFTSMKKRDAYATDEKVLWYVAQANLLYKNYSMSLIGQNGGAAAIRNSTGYRQPPAQA